MKKLMIVMVFAFVTIQSAFAIDQASIDALKKQGFQVRMGELTGAGGKMSSLVRLAGFIHPNGIVMKGECKAIAVSSNANEGNAKVSDITKVVIDNNIIPATEFEGFFTFQ